MKDLYSILELSKNASEQDIKQSYRKLAYEYHPDKNKDESSSGRFKEISEAYEILSDSKKKHQFDQFGYQSLQNLSSPLDLFSSLFGSQMNANGGVFMFAQSMMKPGPTQPTVKKTPTMRYDLHVSLKDLYYGVKKEFSIKHKLKDGTVKKTKYDINVKPGSKHKSSIHVKDGGNYLDKYNVTEDLEIRIQCKDHSILKRYEDDLFVSQTITLAQSLCDSIITIDYFDTELQIQSDTVIQPNSVMMIPDKGMPIKGSDNQYGDLYIEMKIDYPEYVSIDEQVILKDLWNPPTEVEEDVDTIDMKYFGTKDDYLQQKKITKGSSPLDGDLFGEIGEGLSDCISQ